MTTMRVVMIYGEETWTNFGGQIYINESELKNKGIYFIQYSMNHY